MPLAEALPYTPRPFGVTPYTPQPEPLCEPYTPMPSPPVPLLMPRTAAENPPGEAERIVPTIAATLLTTDSVDPAIAPPSPVLVRLNSIPASACDAEYGRVKPPPGPGGPAGPVGPVGPTPMTPGAHGPTTPPAPEHTGVFCCAPAASTGIQTWPFSLTRRRSVELAESRTTKELPAVGATATSAAAADCASATAMS